MVRLTVIASFELQSSRLRGKTRNNSLDLEALQAPRCFVRAFARLLQRASSVTIEKVDAQRLALYIHGMSRSLRFGKTEKIFSRERSPRLAADIQQVALRKPRMLDRALTPQDLRAAAAIRSGAGISESL